MNEIGTERREIRGITRLVITIILIVMMVFVNQYGRKIARPDSRQNSILIEGLDKKQEKVMALTTAMTAASIVVSAIPDDTATPIAQRLMDMTSYTFVSLGAIVVEKYAAVLLQYLGLVWFVPIGLLLIVIALYLHFSQLMSFGSKIIILGLVMALIVTGSEKASNFIYDTYAESIDSTIESANIAVEEYENGQEDEDKAWYTAIADKAGELFSTVTGAIDWAKNILNRFIEAVTVMLVICCVIPVITIVVFLFVIKWLLGINVNFSEFRAPRMEVGRGKVSVRNRRDDRSDYLD